MRIEIEGRKLHPADSCFGMIGSGQHDVAASTKANRPFARSGQWYGINFAGTQSTQWDFQNNKRRAALVRMVKQRINSEV